MAARQARGMRQRQGQGQAPRSCDLEAILRGVNIDESVAAGERATAQQRGAHSARHARWKPLAVRPM